MFFYSWYIVCFLAAPKAECGWWLLIWYIFLAPQLSSATSAVCTRWHWSSFQGEFWKVAHVKRNQIWYKKIGQISLYSYSIRCSCFPSFKSRCAPRDMILCVHFSGCLRFCPCRRQPSGVSSPQIGQTRTGKNTKSDTNTSHLDIYTGTKKRLSPPSRGGGKVNIIKRPFSASLNSFKI